MMADQNKENYYKEQTRTSKTVVNTAKCDCLSRVWFSVFIWFVEANGGKRARQAQSASPARGEEHKIRISPCLRSTEKGKNKNFTYLQARLETDHVASLRDRRHFSVPLTNRDERKDRVRGEACAKRGARKKWLKCNFFAPSHPPPFPGARLPIALSFWFWFLPLFGKNAKKVSISGYHKSHVV